MIKKIICEFNDVKEWQKFKMGGTEYIKVPSPEMPYRVGVIKQRRTMTDKYITEGWENFSPNAYNIACEDYEEIPQDCECIIEGTDIKENNIRKGHWIDKGDDYKCSECGTLYYDESHFCPDCGANMEAI